MSFFGIDFGEKIIRINEFNNKINKINIVLNFNGKDYFNNNMLFKSDNIEYCIDYENNYYVFI